VELQLQEMHQVQEKSLSTFSTNPIEQRHKNLNESQKIASGQAA
jgi:hypothetical protein